MYENNNILNDVYLKGMREKYPRTFQAMFFTTKNGLVLSNADNGLIAYMEALCDATTTPQIRDLVAFTDIAELYQKRCLFVHNMTIFGFDATKDSLSTTADEIIDSQIITPTNTRAFAQSSYFRSAMPVIFQPNFCRPELRINSKLVNQGVTAGPQGQQTHKGFLSLGLPLNTCIALGEEIEDFYSISLRSAFAQYEPTTNRYQNYPLQIIVEFWVD